MKFYLPESQVILNHKEFIGILKKINNQPELSKDNVVSKIAHELQEKSKIHDVELQSKNYGEKHPVYKTMYKKWADNSFAVDYDLLSVVNVSDCSSKRLLHIATENDLANMVHVLIEAGADVDVLDVSSGLSPLHLAAKNGHADVVKLLLSTEVKHDAKDKNECTPLHLAAKNGCADVVKLLLSTEVKYDAKDKSECTPLHLAAENGHKDVVELLLQKKVEVNAVDMHGRTPLHIAVRYGHEKVVELLLAKGADFNVANFNGSTALHVAARHGHGKVVELLLEKGADPNAPTNNKFTPLHLAVRSHNVSIVKLLLEKGADVNAINHSRCTSLHYAVKCPNNALNALERLKQVVIVKFLLKKCADPLLKDERNYTPKDLVNKWIDDAESKEKIIRLLEEAEKKQSKKDDEEISLHSIQDDADSGYGEEKLADSDEKHDSPLVPSSSSHVEDDNQNEPSFLSKYKWEIGVGIGTIAIAVTAFVVLLLTTNSPVLAIIGAAFVLIAGGIAGSVAHVMSQPSTEIEKVAENNLEQHASEGIKI